MYLLCILSIYYGHYSSNPSLWVAWLENQFAKNHFFHPAVILWSFRKQPEHKSKVYWLWHKTKSVLEWKSSIQRKWIFKNLEKYHFKNLKWLGNESVYNFQSKIISSRNKLKELYCSTHQKNIFSIYNYIQYSVVSRYIWSKKTKTEALSWKYPSIDFFRLLMFNDNSDHNELPNALYVSSHFIIKSSLRDRYYF